MKFIIEAIKLLFSKKERERELNLTPEQKKKYRKQYWAIMRTTILLFVPLVFGLGDSIVEFFKTGDLIWVALAIVFGFDLEKIGERTKQEVTLIEERIEKREKRNIKQNRRILHVEQSSTKQGKVMIQ